MTSCGFYVKKLVVCNLIRPNICHKQAQKIYRPFGGVDRILLSSRSSPRTFLGQDNRGKSSRQRRFQESYMRCCSVPKKTLKIKVPEKSVTTRQTLAKGHFESNDAQLITDWKAFFSHIFEFIVSVKLQRFTVVLVTLLS
jgi:hypothetical protein